MSVKPDLGASLIKKCQRLSLFGEGLEQGLADGWERADLVNCLANCSECGEIGIEGTICEECGEPILKITVMPTLVISCPSDCEYCPEWRKCDYEDKI